MSSHKIETTGAQNQRSRLISAINEAFTQHEQKPLPQDSQFGFNGELTTNDVVLKTEEFDMEFDIPFDDDLIANEAEFVIYNLSEDTANRFKVGNPISMTAGYGSDTGVIFKGYISKATTLRQGVDRVTTVYALDDVKYTPQMMEEKTYSKLTKASTILKDLLERLELDIEVFEPPRDFTYEDETKVDGNIVENIKSYSDVCGVSTYIYKQRVYCRPLSEGDNLHFNVNVNTGMIDSPEPFEEENTNEKYVDKVQGFNVNMILQHRIATAGIINLDSINYSGEYRIQSGTHSYDGLSATTSFRCIGLIETTDTTAKSAEEEKITSVKIDREGIVAERIEAAVNYALAIANDERYGFTAKWYPSEFEYNPLTFILDVWIKAGVTCLANTRVTWEDVPTTQYSYSAYLQDFLQFVNRRWGNGDPWEGGIFNYVEHFHLQRGLADDIESFCDIETGDIFINDGSRYSPSLNGSYMPIALYIGNSKFVRAFVRSEADDSRDWIEAGDQDGKEICVCDFADIVAEIPEDTGMIGKIYRYVGEDIPTEEDMKKDMRNDVAREMQWAASKYLNGNIRDEAKYEEAIQEIYKKYGITSLQDLYK